MQEGGMRIQAAQADVTVKARSYCKAPNGRRLAALRKAVRAYDKLTELPAWMVRMNRAMKK
jgi:hypothetical protein